MILGIGVDLLNVDRVENLYSKFRDKLAKKILSNVELIEYNDCKNPINFLAKRFCSKEAFSKAVGVGIGRGIDFKDITIKKDKLGKPFIELNEKALSFLQELFKVDVNINLSISDEKPYINTFVVIDKK